MATTETKIVEIKVESAAALNRIVELTNSLNENSKSVQELNKDYSEQKITLDAYTKSLSILKAAEKAQKDELRTLGNEIKNVIKQETEQLGYIQKLEAEVSNLTLKYKQLSEAELKGAKGKETTELLTKKRAELQSLNTAYGNYSMNVGNYSSATKMMAINMSQVLREMPNFAISARIGIMSLTNNLPMLAENIKQVAAEQKVLNQQFKAGLIDAKPESTVKMLIKSMIGLNGIMALGMVLFQVFGTRIIDWVSDMFKAKDATDSLTESQLGLKTSMEVSREAMKNGGEYKQAVTDINKLSTTLKEAKGNTDLEKQAVDEYNKTLGVTFGKVKNVDDALKLIEKNKTAYIKAMQDMAFANAFFAQSAEDATKAMEVGLKSNAELVGKSSEYYIEEISKLDKIAASTKKRLRELIADGATEQQIKVQTDLVNEYEKKQSDLRTKYNDEAAKQRTIQLELIQKHQNKTLEEATKYYNKYADAFKANNWTIEQETNKSNTKKEKDQTSAFDRELKLWDIKQKAIEPQIEKWLETIRNAELARIKLVTDGRKSLEESLNSENESGDLEVEKLNKSIEQRKKNQEEYLQNQLDATIEGSNAELNAKLAILSNEQAQELAIAGQTEAQKAAIRAKYAKIELDLRVQTLQNNLSATASAFGAIQGLFKKGSKAQKAAASTQIGIDSISGAIAAFKGVVGVPIVGQILAPLAAAGVLASGAKAIKDVWAVKEDGTQSVGASAPSLPPDLTSKMASPLTNSVQSMGATGGSNAIVSGAANISSVPTMNYDALANAMSKVPAPQLSLVELKTKQRQVDFIDNVSTLSS